MCMAKAGVIQCRSAGHKLRMAKEGVIGHVVLDVGFARVWLLMQFLSADDNTESPIITHGALDLEISRNQTSCQRKQRIRQQVWEKEALAASLGRYPDLGDLLPSPSAESAYRYGTYC